MQNLRLMLSDGGVIWDKSNVAPAGGHQFTATYNGKQNFVTSVSANVPYTVGALNTTTDLGVDFSTQVFGQNVTFQGDAAVHFFASCVCVHINHR